MLKLREIMTSDVITVSPDLTLRETMELFAGKHISGAPVVSGKKVVGVISAADLLSFAATLPGVPTERPEQSEWGELESPPEENEGEEPAGMYFTEMWSDAGSEVDERFAEVAGPEWNVLAEHTVAEAMTRSIYSLASDADVFEAADYMRRERVHRILVIDGAQLRGIVSTMDIANAVAQHQLTTRTYVFGRERDFDERGEWQASRSDDDGVAAGDEETASDDR